MTIKNLPKKSNFLRKLSLFFYSRSQVLSKSIFQSQIVLISHFKTHLKPLFGQNSRSIQNKLNELSVIKIMFRYSFCIVTQFCILSLLFSVRIGSQVINSSKDDIQFKHTYAQVYDPLLLIRNVEILTYFDNIYGVFTTFTGLLIFR